MGVSKMGKMARLACLAVAMTCGSAFAADKPSIAVTDLTYEEAVKSYFSFVDAHHQSNAQGSMGQFSASESGSYTSASGEITQISRGELHKFTGDIRGALLKSGAYRLVQGKPWTQSDTTTIPAGCIPPHCDGRPSTFTEQVTIYDVIDRIKKGYYAGADYVLFGTISSIQSRNEAMPIQATNAVNYSLSLELMAEFSLINTKTYEIVAAFSALGEGNDARLINTSGAVITLSRGKVMQAVSRSLGDAALNEIQTQFNPSGVVSQGGPGKVQDQPVGQAIQFR
jgi:hypothetical protein